MPADTAEREAEALFAEIEARLRGHPELAIEKTATSLEVAPRDDGGFPVAVLVEPNGFLVHYAGWHEHFERARDALHCFSYGLFGDCRLRVSYRGTTAHRWTLEHRRGGTWIAESTTGRWLFPFWRRARTVTLRNRSEPG